MNLTKLFSRSAPALALSAGLLFSAAPAFAGNPVFTDVFTADPAPLVDGDTVYVYTTHDEAPPKQWLVMNDWLCYSSKDMKTWTAHGPVASKKTFAWGTNDAWAAQTVKKDGKYYLYTTLCGSSQYSGRCIGVAVSDTPTGPFKDAIGKPLVYDRTTPGPYGWDDMDPTAFIDDDGTPWLAWGHTICYLAKLKPNMIEIDGEIKMMRLPNYTEGPWIFKRNGLYYLVYVSHILNGFHEKASYAVAKSMEGPWKPMGIMCEDTKNSDCIHPGVAEFKGNWYFFYLNGALTLADGQKGDAQHRSVCLDYMYFNPDGTIQLVEQTDKGTEDAPKTAAQIAAAVPKGEVVKLPPFPGISVSVSDPAPSVKPVSTFNNLKWPGSPVLACMEKPYAETNTRDGFRQNGGTDSFGQSFVAPKDMQIESVALYAGNGEITPFQPEQCVKIAIFDLGESDSNAQSYQAGQNLIPSDGSRAPEFIYRPQGAGLLKIDFAVGRQVQLKKGHTYVFELQAPRNSHPISWYRSDKDTFSTGSAYRGRKKITNRGASVDFGFAIYGK